MCPRCAGNYGNKFKQCCTSDGCNGYTRGGPFCHRCIRRKHRCRGVGAQGQGYGLVTPTGQPLPTKAPPGTAAKIAALEFRAASGVHLWHPADMEA